MNIIEQLEKLREYFEQEYLENKEEYKKTLMRFYLGYSDAMSVAEYKIKEIIDGEKELFRTEEQDENKR